jgi:fluoroacetyl-CoA thioesterase
MHVEVGVRATVTAIVTERDTAIALGSGDVAVLGTPRVVALCEEACVAALVGHLAPGQTSVGVKVQLDHLQPTAVGGAVSAEAVLERSEGRRLMFHVKVDDHRGMIATGLVTRVVVDAERFMHKIT